MTYRIGTAYTSLHPTHGIESHHGRISPNQTEVPDARLDTRIQGARAGIRVLRGASGT